MQGVITVASIPRFEFAAGNRILFTVVLSLDERYGFFRVPPG